MKLQVKFKIHGFADCDLDIRAKGFLACALYWADEAGPLSGWSSFAVVPVDPAGNAHYCLEGHRAIPVCATHIYAKCISQDFFTVEEALVVIPEKYRTRAIHSQSRGTFSVLSDLHLSGKPGKISRTLGMAKSPILIPGDLTNDGYEEQFVSFRKCIEEVAEDKLILSVTGNHDQLLKPALEFREGCFDYGAFQQYLFSRAEKLGCLVCEDSSGAYSARLGEVDVIGLQCVELGRKFTFPEDAQLQWLSRHLDETRSAPWHIILCHGPLLRHNPHRREGMPYLAGDSRLQQILDSHRNIIFLSGHTHFSPNTRQGNAEYCAETQTLYLDDGSVTPTELGGEPLMPAEWKHGVIMELTLYSDGIEIKTRSVHTGILYPRGYYRFGI